MNGWYFILMGVILVAFGGILTIYGQQLNSPSTPVGAVFNNIHAHQITVGRDLVQVLPSGPDTKISAATTSPPLPGPTLLENPSFERGSDSWGSGWFESLFPVPAPLRSAISFNGASAKWYVDGRRARTGAMALRVEHGSDYTPHVYSCFSQRVRLKPNTTYRVGFWLNVEVGGSRGGFGIRFLPSRTVEAEEWDRRKVTASKIKIGE